MTRVEVALARAAAMRAEREAVMGPVAFAEFEALVELRKAAALRLVADFHGLELKR